MRETDGTDFVCTHSATRRSFSASEHLPTACSNLQDTSLFEGHPNRVHILTKNQDYLNPTYANNP